MRNNIYILSLLLSVCFCCQRSLAETVYFKNKAVWNSNGTNVKWETVYIHYWGEGIVATTWGDNPAMEYIGNDWWKYDVPANGKPYSFLCKNSSAWDPKWQSADQIGKSGDVACYSTADAPYKLAYTSIPSNKIYFYNTNNWSKVCAHIWSASNSIDTTTWGQLPSLKDEGGGWWSAPIVSDNFNCLFASSANGDNKTGDRSYNSTLPYYKDSEWYASKKTRRTMAFSAGAIYNWGRQRMTTADDEETTQHTQHFETVVREGEFGIQECRNHNVTDKVDWWYASTSTPTITKDTTIQLISEKNGSNGTNPKITVCANKDVTFTYFYDSHTLKIKYAPSTVRFDLQGHGDAIADISDVAVGDKISAPTSPTAEGYTFGGWYTDAACTNEYDFNSIVNEDITLYANWTADPWSVSFGVVNPEGGQLTAKEGDRELANGEVVSHATFTATPNKGYVVEGWYSDINGTQKIDGAGDATTYRQDITIAGNIVYVKFKLKQTIYFKNTFGWSKVYVYTFSASPWDDRFIKPQQNRIEFSEMQRLNDSVFYFERTSTTAATHVAFTRDRQDNYNQFHQTTVVACNIPYQEAMPLYIPNAAAQGDSENRDQCTYYFDNNVLFMSYGTLASGYNLRVKTDGDYTDYPMLREANDGAMTASKTLSLIGGTTYTFYIKNPVHGRAYSNQTGPTVNGEGVTLSKYDDGNAAGMAFTPAYSGEYTFQIDLYSGQMVASIRNEENAYRLRLVYVEKSGATIVKFHPSDIIPQSKGAQRDTISLYVKPFVRKNNGTNPNTCEVWIQKRSLQEGKLVWNTAQNINIKDYSTTFSTNGVYNFVLVQDGNGGFTVPMKDVHPYRGEYYIRVGLNKNYRSAENQFRFSDYASKYDERFDHYVCQWQTTGADVRFTVACDYSSCVSDTLAQEPDDDPHHNYTNANGIMQHIANVRFMWNSENNSIDRDYLAGSGSNVILLSQSGISTTQNGGAETNVVLTDVQNWVYQHDVYAAVGTRVKLRVKPYNDANEYLYLKGKDGDFSNENTVELIGGSQGKTLKVRMIYDFKSNHLICAWLPEQSNTIEGELSLNSDLILIRKEHNEAQQITFQGDNAQITKISQAYGVLSLSRSHFGDKNVLDNAKKFYWISFPFDVHLSEVFSALTYGKDYVLKYYDGAERAEKGCWKDSPSFWKMYRSTEGVKLEKGKGYLLHVNISDTASFFAKGNQEVNIYFPSANTDSMTISGAIEETIVPAHTCTIERGNRKIYDSNWNLIGVPSWANVDEMRLPNATAIEGFSVKFLYDYVPNTNGYNTVDATKYNFGSMKAYMVQFAGTINWKEKSITPSQQPLRAPAAANEQTIRLDLLRGEERLDHTFVQLSDNEGITEDFDLNSDLTKVHNNGCNLYTLIGSEQIEAAANILPMSERTIYVPVGVSVDSDGTYSLALPEEMEGMDVRIADAETGYTHNLLFSPYEVSLTAGTHTQRFSLEIHASSQVTTGCSETDAAGERLRKVLLDGHFIIQYGEKVYDAQGKRLW